MPCAHRPKTYTLRGPDGKSYASSAPGKLGGHCGGKLYFSFPLAPPARSPTTQLLYRRQVRRLGGRGIHWNLPGHGVGQGLR